MCVPMPQPVQPHDPKSHITLEMETSASLSSEMRDAGGVCERLPSQILVACVGAVEGAAVEGFVTPVDAPGAVLVEPGRTG